jgi:hypothetical protein
MRTFYLTLFITLLYACGGDNEASNYPEIDSSYFRSDFLEGEMFFDLKENIERSEGLADAKSLEFMSADGALLKATAKIDSFGEVHMLILEKEFENKLKDELFFYKNGLKRISLKSLTEFKEESNYYSEMISFYGDSGNVIYTGIRNATDIDSLKWLSYTGVDKTNHSDEFTLNLLKREGAFETRFLGMAYSKEQGKLFLVVGPENRAYTSTLAVVEKSDFLNELIEYENKNIGIPLDIDFVHTTQTDGFSYQTLLKVSATVND